MAQCNHAVLHIARGQAFAALNQVNSAEEAFRSSLTICSRCNHYGYLPFYRVIASRELLVLCLARQGRVAEGLALLKDALKAIPQDPETLEYYSRVILKHGLDASAILADKFDVHDLCVGE